MHCRRAYRIIQAVAPCAASFPSALHAFQPQTWCPTSCHPPGRHPTDPSSPASPAAGSGRLSFPTPDTTSNRSLIQSLAGSPFFSCISCRAQRCVKLSTTHNQSSTPNHAFNCLLTLLLLRLLPLKAAQQALKPLVGAQRLQIRVGPQLVEVAVAWGAGEGRPGCSSLAAQCGRGSAPPDSGRSAAGGSRGSLAVQCGGEQSVVCAAVGGLSTPRWPKQPVPRLSCHAHLPSASAVVWRAPCLTAYSSTCARAPCSTQPASATSPLSMSPSRLRQHAMLYSAACTRKGRASYTGGGTDCEALRYSRCCTAQPATAGGGEGGSLYRRLAPHRCLCNASCANAATPAGSLPVDSAGGASTENKPPPAGACAEQARKAFDPHRQLAGGQRGRLVAPALEPRARQLQRPLKVLLQMHGVAASLECLKGCRLGSKLGAPAHAQILPHGIVAVTFRKEMRRCNSGVTAAAGFVAVP